MKYNGILLRRGRGGRGEREKGGREGREERETERGGERDRRRDRVGNTTHEHIEQCNQKLLFCRRLVVVQITVGVEQCWVGVLGRSGTGPAASICG